MGVSLFYFFSASLQSLLLGYLLKSHFKLIFMLLAIKLSFHLCTVHYFVPDFRLYEYVQLILVSIVS
ncbi:hypothetical protein BRADI_4g43318v3 [Brachypodium distachyon]|uniref:Uncharacterized protein n=1 Tax=Brachypodium distachyon TaxID=15368 RepID=A0A0Q3F1G8_BRADI|nr:hypothetical protein BRADI_4g43318v3 [Brachypodium distachyon]